MRRIIAATAAFLLGTTLAGCDGSDDAPTDPPATTSSATPIEPTATQTDGPPELPKAATEKTTAGAKALLDYFVLAINYGGAKRDGTPLSAVSSRACRTCQTLIDNFNGLRRDGGRQVGGEWTLLKSGRVSTDDRSQPRYLIDVDAAKGRWWATSTSEMVRMPAQRVQYILTLRYARDSWRVLEVDAA